MWITFLNPLKDYVLSHFFNQTQQNAIKRNMYSYLTTDQKAWDSNSPGRAKKPPTRLAGGSSHCGHSPKATGDA